MFWDCNCSCHIVLWCIRVVYVRCRADDVVVSAMFCLVRLCFTLAARVFGGCPKIKRCVSSTQGKGLDMCICFRIAIVRGALYYVGLKLMLCFVQVSPTLNGRQWCYECGLHIPLISAPVRGTTHSFILILHLHSFIHFCARDHLSTTSWRRRSPWPHQQVENRAPDNREWSCSCHWEPEKWPERTVALDIPHDADFAPVGFVSPIGHPSKRQIPQHMCIHDW